MFNIRFDIQNATQTREKFVTTHLTFEDSKGTKLSFSTSSHDAITELDLDTDFIIIHFGLELLSVKHEVSISAMENWITFIYTLEDQVDTSMEVVLASSPKLLANFKSCLKKWQEVVK